MVMPALEERARVDAGRAVTLEEDPVSRVQSAPVEEVVETNFIQRGRRGKRRDVPANAASSRLARTTMAIAFQRMRLLMRRSISWLPG